MNHFSKLLLGASFATLAIASQAASVRAVDVPRISNGGTGFIGVTQSAAAPEVMTYADRTVQRVSSMSGEATTMVNGQPNVNPEAPMTGSAPAADVRSMGAARMASGAPGTRGMLWGTPD